MDVQEYVDVLIFYAEEVKDISCPIHFVLHDLLEEVLNIFQSLLGRLIENLCNIYIFNLSSRRNIFVCRKLRFDISEFIYGLIV